MKAYNKRLQTGFELAVKNKDNLTKFPISLVSVLLCLQVDPDSKDCPNQLNRILEITEIN